VQYRERRFESEPVIELPRPPGAVQAGGEIVVAG